MKNLINRLFMLLPAFSLSSGCRGKVCESRGCGGVGRIGGVAMSDYTAELLVQTNSFSGLFISNR